MLWIGYFRYFYVFFIVKIDIELWGGPQMSSEGLAGILGAPRGVLRGQEAMDLIAYGCSRWVSGGCVLVFLMYVYSVS